MNKMKRVKVSSAGGEDKNRKSETEAKADDEFWQQAAWQEQSDDEDVKSEDFENNSEFEDIEDSDIDAVDENAVEQQAEQQALREEKELKTKDKTATKTKFQKKEPALVAGIKRGRGRPKKNNPLISSAQLDNVKGNEVEKRLKPWHALTQQDYLREAVRVENESKKQLAALLMLQEEEKPGRLSKEKGIDLVKGAHVVKTRSNRLGTTVSFGNEDDIVYLRSGGRLGSKTISQLKKEHSGQVLCSVTGLPAKYRDPLTKLPYANSHAFKVIRGRAVNLK